MKRCEAQERLYHQSKPGSDEHNQLARSVPLSDLGRTVAGDVRKVRSKLVLLEAETINQALLLGAKASADVSEAVAMHSSLSLGQERICRLLLLANQWLRSGGCHMWRLCPT